MLPVQISKFGECSCSCLPAMQVLDLQEALSVIRWHEMKLLHVIGMESFVSPLKKYHIARSLGLLSGGVGSTMRDDSLSSQHTLCGMGLPTVVC